MGKPKDSSKNRKWEQIRRERLNETFSDLCKELPGKTNGGLLSKKAILCEALAFIQQLQKDKKQLQDTLAEQQTSCHRDDVPGHADVKSHVGILLCRQRQLIELLRNAGIAVPPDPNADQVSAQWSPKIFETCSVSAETKGVPVSDKKKKSAVSVLTPMMATPNGFIERVVLAEKTKPMNPLSRKNKDTARIPPRKKVTKKSSGPAPFVVQSLPPQIVLAPGSTPTVPVIVSVAGVKTLNPVIVVQSKPLVTCTTTASFSSRPIRPCPAVRPPGTKAKVPIPALKPKMNESSTKKKVRSVKAKTKITDSTKEVAAKCSGSAGPSESTVPEALSLDFNDSRTKDRVKQQCDGQKDPVSGPNAVLTCSGMATKENAWTDKNGKRVIEGGGLVTVASKRMKSSGIVQESMKDLAGFLNSESAEHSPCASSPSKSTPKSGSYSISALCSLEQQQNHQRQEQRNLQHQRILREDQSQPQQDQSQPQQDQSQQPLGQNQQPLGQNQQPLGQNQQQLGQSQQQLGQSQQQLGQSQQQLGQSQQQLCQSQQQGQSRQLQDQNQQQQDQSQQLQEQRNLQHQNPQQRDQENLQKQHEQQNQQVNLLQQKHQLQNQQQQDQSQQLQEQRNLQHQNPQQRDQENLQKQHEQQNQQVNLLQQKHQMQNQQHQRDRTEENQHPQDRRQKKKQHQQDGHQIEHLHQVVQQQIHHEQQQVCVESSITPQSSAKPAYDASKTKEVYVPSNEQYLEWVEKSGSKSRFDSRTYHSYSSYPVHNSRNTFMPITETEVFDGSENAFGLSLNAPDISGDLFTSLQVPNGGQHSESISPTAAFLLTFPLVSTSKASELLPDESGCENTDSQSGLKTILQIGNIDSSLNKCSNNIFSVADEGLNNFSLPSHYAQNGSSQKDNHVIRPSEDTGKSAQTSKDCTGLVFKETAMLLEKDAGSNTLDQSALYLNKNSQVQHSKTDQQTSLIVSTAESTAVNQSSVASVVEAKSKCSSGEPSESQKTARERKEDRWLSSHQNTSTVNPFGDFVVTNTLRQDCSFNFPALPSSIVPHASTSQSYPTSDVNFKVPTTQTSVASSFSIAQTSPNIGILSWSTLPAADTYSPSRNNPKLARFHDIFPYRSTTGTETAPASTTYTMPTDPKAQTNYVSASEHSFFQEAATSTDVRSRTHGESYSSGTSRSRVDVAQLEGSGKKQFSWKQTYAQGIPQHMAQHTTQQHANMIGRKQLCIQETYDKHSPSIGQGLCHSSIGVEPKQNGANGNTMLGGKHGNYAQWNDAKGSQRQQLESFSGNVSAMLEPKSDGNAHLKKSSSSNINSSDKDGPSLSTYIASNGSVSETREARETRMSQCNQADASNASLHHKEAFKSPHQLQSQTHKQSHQMNSKSAQKHYQQSEPQPNQGTIEIHQEPNSATVTLPCTRSAKTTMSIHRPPVNWMTAPDIRSSLQNTPAFGNNQTAFYIPDLQKESDAAVTGSMFDTTNSFHCLDLPHTAGQSIFKSSDFQLLSSDQLEGIHEPTAWSPSKSGNNNVLGSMLIPSTLPTLVGDLALGETNANISRPFLPTFPAESSPCSKKTSKRSHSTKNFDKTIDDGQGAEFSTNFLSVSQLVDSNASRNRRRQASGHNRMANIGEGPSYPVPFSDQDISQCSQSKQSSSKSSYSAEALLSNSALNAFHVNRKKRPLHSTQYSSNYAPPPVPAPAPPDVASQAQCNFLPDLSVSRSNDFQSGLSHAETLPNPFLLPASSCNTSSSHRNGINPDDESQIRRGVPQVPSDNLHLTVMTVNKQVPAIDVGMSYESNFPAFLPPVSVAVGHYPYAQDALYTTPRFQMHPNATNHNNNVQSPSANTLTNFHLSTIFPEINGKVIC